MIQRFNLSAVTSASPGAVPTGGAAAPVQVIGTVEEVMPPRTNVRFPWVLLGLICTVGTAIVTGAMSSRWGTAVDFEPLIQRLESVPKSLGPWEFVVAGDPIPKQYLAEFKERGQYHGVFTNRENGRVARVLLLLGAAGPLVTHPPELCYTNSGNPLAEPPRDIPIGDLGSLKALKFTPSDPSDKNFTVLYGYTDGERWILPAGRLKDSLLLAGKPYLFKLQIVCPDEPQSIIDDPSANAAVVTLASDLLKHLRDG
jgi:hypothetical protein